MRVLIIIFKDLEVILSGKGGGREEGGEARVRATLGHDPRSSSSRGGDGKCRWGGGKGSSGTGGYSRGYSGGGRRSSGKGGGRGRSGMGGDRGRSGMGGDTSSETGGNSGGGEE